jgi:hypothetical protein
MPEFMLLSASANDVTGVSAFCTMLSSLAVTDYSSGWALIFPAEVPDFFQTALTA